MGKQEVIDYVMTTPSNPNKAVLSGMLDDIGNANVPTPTVEDAGKVLGVGDNGKYVLEEAPQGGDVGYECTEEMVVILNESVTTVDSGMGVSTALITPSSPIEGDSVVVTLDGTEYELPKIIISGTTYYGEYNDGIPSFENYPCIIAVSSEYNMFATKNAGTYQVKIETTAQRISSVTDCFKMAVEQSTSAFEVQISKLPSEGTAESPSITNISYDEIEQAFLSGKVVILSDHNRSHLFSASLIPGLEIAVTYQSDLDDTITQYVYQDDGNGHLVCPPIH